MSASLASSESSQENGGESAMYTKKAISPPTVNQIEQEEFF